MDDDAVSLKQVLITIVIGALIGGLLSLLLYVASATVREQAYWLIPAIIGVCIVLALWIRYAPWWLDSPLDWW